MKWLDDQRLYLYLEDYYALPEAIKQEIPFTQYVIWNVDTDHIELAKARPGTFCYHLGHSGYIVSKDTAYFYAGPWGREKEVMRRRFTSNGRPVPHEQQRYVSPDGTAWPDSTRFYFNRFNCQLTEWQRLGKGRAKWPLFASHGYIVTENDGFKLTYFSMQDPTIPVPLPFRFNDLNHSTFPSFLGMYMIPKDLTAVSGRRGLEIYFLSPAGDLRKESIPGGPWFGASKGLHATRVGIVIWSHNRLNMAGDGDAGLYLAKGEKVVRFLRGFPGPTAVSPDGCRIAARMERPNFKLELKIVDMCRERN